MGEPCDLCDLVVFPLVFVSFYTILESTAANAI